MSITRGEIAFATPKLRGRVDHASPLCTSYNIKSAWYSALCKIYSDDWLYSSVKILLKTRK